jgi:hypothetical protein
LKGSPGCVRRPLLPPTPEWSSVFSAVAFRSAPVPAMAPKAPRASRNKELVRGIGRNGRSKTYHKRGLWAIKAKNGGTFPSHEKAAPAAPPAARAPKFYPADDVKTPLHKNKVVNAPKIRYASGFRV